MKALVLAGGFPQISLISELKKRKIKVVLADYYSEPVAKKYADRFYQVSTLDVDAIRYLVQTEKVDFIITVCTDQALLTTAQISNELGLPCYLDFNTALNVTNKRYMKQMFYKNAIPTAKHVSANKIEDIELSNFSFPLIVKPVDCNSSKGVRRCNNYIELETYFHEAVNLSRTKNAIVEEFIEGIEISVDIYVEDGKVKILCISESDKISETDKFVICRAIWPLSLSESLILRIQKIAQSIADAFLIINSPMLIQFLYNGKDLYVIEFSARTGGGVKYLLIKRASGFDVINAVIDLTLGEKPHVEEIVAEYRFMVNDFIYCGQGVFDHLEGFEELKNNHIIEDYYLFKRAGTLFESVSASGDRVAGFTVVGDTPEELINRHSRAINSIKVISTDGRDIARHDLLTGLVYRNGQICSLK